MTTLSINLLGSFSAWLDNQPIHTFATTKVRGLLAYLAVEGNRPLDRSHLAGILWPDKPEESARGNFRYSLTNLRKAVGDGSAEPPYFLINRRTMQLNPSALEMGLLEIDINRFEASYAQSANAFQSALDAINLYRGTFLEEMDGIDSPEFEAWIGLQREMRHRQMADLLALVTQQMFASREFAQSVSFAQQLVDHEPWREEAHVQLMNALWHNGQGHEAMRQYHRCCRILENGLDVKPSPETEALYEAIRDSRSEFQIEMPISVSNVRHKGARASVDSTSSALTETPYHSIPLHNIPSLLNNFFGREREMAELSERLGRPTCRLLTLIGPGGIGKTRFALEYARRCVDSSVGKSVDSYRDGVWFVSLTEVSDGDQIPTAIAGALGIPLSPEHEPLARISQFLRNRALLLILDNFEHLLSHVTLVTDLLNHSSELRLLVTSRERLNLQVETVFALGGLDLPQEQSTSGGAAHNVGEDDEDSEDEQSVFQSSALALFEDCARKAESSFTLNAHNRLAAVDICQLTDGMPLAIELAAVWTRILSCQEILESLTRGIDILATTMPDMPQRHRSIRALFEQSWHQLSAEAQRIFMQLTVFQGSMEWSGLQFVTNATPNSLAELIDRNFVHKLPSGRYTFHELLRQFGSQHLAQSNGYEAEARGNHACYFAEFLSQQTSLLMGPQQADTLKQVHQELSNIRIAWRWLVEQRDLSQLSKSFDSLFQFYSLRGLAQEGAFLFGQLVTALSTNNADERQLLIRSSNRQATFQIRLARYVKARNQLKQNLALAEKYHLAAERAWATLWLGVAYEESDVLYAEQLYLQSLDLYRSLDEPYGIVSAMEYLMRVLPKLSRFKEAMDYAEQALQLARKHDWQDQIAHLLLRYALILCDGEKAFDAAEAHCLEALSIFQGLKNRFKEAESWNHAAVIAAVGNQYEIAYERFHKGLVLSRALGVHTGVIVSNLARLANILEKYEEAISLYDEAIQVNLTIEQSATLVRSYEGLATAALGVGDTRRARHALANALNYRDVLKEFAISVLCLVTSGQLLVAEGAFEDAALVLLFVQQFGDSLLQPDLMPLEVSRLEAALAKTRAALSPEKFEYLQVHSVETSFEDVLDLVATSLSRSQCHSVWLQSLATEPENPSLMLRSTESRTSVTI
ncbi:MAG: BTAD domain-containing putative transcriptional regulator [Chloroflexota bacterium]